MAEVKMKSALTSKVNWTQVVGAGATVVALIAPEFGAKLTPEVQLALVVIIQGITQGLTIVFRTFYTTALTQSSVNRDKTPGALVFPLMLAIVATAALAGCEKAFPRTTAGFEEGGIVGAIGGASDGLVELADEVTIACQAWDMSVIPVVVRVVSTAAGLGGPVTLAREVKDRVCMEAGFIAALDTAIPVEKPVVE